MTNKREIIKKEFNLSFEPPFKVRSINQSLVIPSIIYYKINS
jgi:hypothetical protein